LTTYSCVTPSQPKVPYRIDGTATDITLGWSAPSSDGGCYITGYRLFRDDGASGTITTEVDAASINDKPYLTSYTVTLTAADTGNLFRF
jgi:hypothetical protein